MSEFEPHDDGHDGPGIDGVEHDVGPLEHHDPASPGVHPGGDAPPLDDSGGHELHFPGDPLEEPGQRDDGFADDDRFARWLDEDRGGDVVEDPAADTALRDKLIVPDHADGLAAHDDLIDWTLRQGR